MRLLEPLVMFALIAASPAPQAPVTPTGRRCVPLDVTVEGGGPPPRSLAFSLTGAAARSTAVVFTSTTGILLPADERRIVLTTPLPEGYTLRRFTYGGDDLLQAPLRVGAGPASALSLTFTAAPGSWATVSGRLTGVDLAARDYYVSLNSGAVQQEERRLVARDGSFAFPAVLKGRYSLAIDSSGGLPASLQIAVTGQPLSGVEIVAPPQREVAGLVIREGETRGVFYSFRLLLQNGTRQIAISHFTASDGMFRMALPDGEWRATLAGFPEGAVRSFTYGTTDLRSEPLRVTPETTGNLRITLAADARPSGVPGGVLFQGPDSCAAPATPSPAR